MSTATIVPLALVDTRFLTGPEPVVGLNTFSSFSYLIENVGQQPLMLTGPVTVPAGFTIATLPSLTTLATGQATSFLVVRATGIPGTYTGDVVIPNTDGDENPFNFTLSSTVLPSRTIDEGSFGYSQQGTWRNVGGIGFSGDFRYTSDASAVATTTFAGLSPGRYRVSATWDSNPYWATNASYLVLDGTVPRGGATINQRLAPDDLIENGRGWEDLAVVNVSGSSLAVRLAAAGADGYVIADGIRIEWIGHLPNERDIQVSVGLNDVADGGSVDFGTVELNRPVTKTFTISNQGAQPLSLTGPVSLPAGYTLVTPPALSTINPGQTTTFVVRLDAQLPGTYAGTISFTNNDNDEGVFDFHINGTVLPVQLADDTPTNTAEFSRTGTWGNASNAGRGGDFRYALDATGNETATWTFNVVPGQYRVAATWPSNPYWATNATYTVFDGTSDRAFAMLSQRAGADDFVDAGSNWEDFGAVYNITSGTLVVRLEARHADGYVIADGIRVEWLGAPLSAAEAGGPYNVPEGASVVLAAGGPSSPEPATYLWDLDGDGWFGETGGAALRGDEVGATPTFNAAQLDGPTAVIVSLQMIEAGQTRVDTARINVLNVAPQVQTGGPYTVAERSTVQLSPAIFDIPSDALRVEWDLDGDGIFGESPSVIGNTPGVFYYPLAQGGNGHYYQFVFPGQRPTWTSARDHAAARYHLEQRGYLATITSAAEAAFVRATFEQTLHDFTGYAWIGLSDAVVEGEFRWVTGEPLAFTDWWPGEPNNLGKDYVGIFAPDDGSWGWKDLPLSGPSSPHMGYLIEYDGPVGSNGDELGPTPVFNAAALDGPGQMQVALRVTDDDGAVTTVSTTISITNAPPTTNAGGPYAVFESGSVTFSGSGLDSPRDTLSYAWDLDGDGLFGESGAAALRGNETGATPTFSALGLTSPSTVTVQLRVTDDDGATSLSSTTVIEVIDVPAVQIIDDAAANTTSFSRTGNWLDVEGLGHESDFRLAKNTTGIEVATWTFNVNPGVHRISTTWFGGTSYYDSSAEFTVFDGAAVRGGNSLNQQSDPDDRLAAGSAWEDIGQFNILGSTLTIELRADDPLLYVLADGIMIERLGDLPGGPEISVLESNREVGAGPVNFGTLELNHPVDKTFTISNIGTVPLTLTSLITVPSGFTLAGAGGARTRPEHSLHRSARRGAAWRLCGTGQLQHRRFRRRHDQLCCERRGAGDADPGQRPAGIHSNERIPDQSDIDRPRW